MVMIRYRIKSDARQDKPALAAATAPRLARDARQRPAWLLDGKKASNQAIPTVE